MRVNFTLIAGRQNNFTLFADAGKFYTQLSIGRALCFDQKVSTRGKSLKHPYLSKTLNDTHFSPYMQIGPKFLTQMA